MINSGPVSPAIFQSTLSRGERPPSSIVPAISNPDFNPLSRMEKDHTIIMLVLAIRFISIHSLAWRKTMIAFVILVMICDFNPLSRMEKDPILFVSIIPY